MEFRTEFIEVLRHARSRFTQRQLAEKLGVDARTVGRWERQETHPQPFVIPALKELLQDPPQAEGASDFTFIDLFAGIGGIRMGFESTGGRCVFTSEWNPFARGLKKRIAVSCN